MTRRRVSPPFRSLLCPVDFSAHSRHALRYATAIAQRFGGSVTVLFVVDPLLLAAARTGYGSTREFVDQSRAELSRFVKQSIGRVTAGLPSTRVFVSAGNPADEILRASSRFRSDLIVIATQGLSGVQRLFFGSTTEHVLRRAAVPVLAIPPLKHGRRMSAPRLTISRVIAPIDLAGEWQSDAIRAAEIAKTFDAELVLVHVLRSTQLPSWLPGTHDVTEDKRVQKAGKALERVRRQLAASAESTSSVLLGDPAMEIARLTEGGSCLVVMSLRGTTGVWGRRGSIAYHVLTHGSTPVLALPRRQIGGRLSARLGRAITETLSARDRTEIAGIDALLWSASDHKALKR